MTQILIADDDQELCELLQDYLSQEGFQVTSVFNGQDAVDTISANTFDLLILDVMMPLKNGFDVLTEIRHFSQLPVIMLTARGEKLDRIVGLEMGADDYIAKPCDPRELVARIRAIVRRTNMTKSSAAKDIITINDLALDINNRQATVNKQVLLLTSTEFDLLKLLAENAGNVVSKEKISEICLGKKLQAFDRSIDMHLSNIRKKLGLYKNSCERIKTIRGNGYQYLIWDHAND